MEFPPLSRGFAMPEILRHYLDAWGLAESQQIAETATSRLYQVVFQNDRAVLKILTNIGVADEAGGAAALRYFNGCGSVRLLRADVRAQLLEHAGPEDLSLLVQRGEDGRATEIIADVLNQLHSPRQLPVPAGLIPLRDRFRSLFDQAERAGADAMYRRAATMADRLLSSSVEPCVLHGDMHHANVLLSSARGWLAIDPKGLYGERTFDAANALLNPPVSQIVLDERRYLAMAQDLALTMDLNPVRLLAFAFAFALLSACWSIEDDQDPSLALAFAEMAERHLHI